MYTYIYIHTYIGNRHSPIIFSHRFLAGTPPTKNLHPIESWLASFGIPRSWILHIHHRKSIGKPWANHENHGKIMGNNSYIWKYIGNPNEIGDIRRFPESWGYP